MGPGLRTLAVRTILCASLVAGWFIDHMHQLIKLGDYVVMEQPRHLHPTYCDVKKFPLPWTDWQMPMAYTNQIYENEKKSVKHLFSLTY